jgi:hypothetical protein
MKRYLPVITAIGLLVVSGVLHGMRTDRWSVPAERRDAADRLAKIPVQIGDWDSQPIPIDERQLTVAQADGHVARRYVNRVTQTEVSVVILCGRPAPLSVHTPDICFAGAGFRLDGKQVRWKPGAKMGREEALWMARFVRPGFDLVATQLYWGWSQGDQWLAPDDARLAFSRAHVLYKLYAAGPPSSIPFDAADADPTRSFLSVLIPELNKRLSPSGPKPPGSR